jgi:hypothetical protein
VANTNYVDVAKEEFRCIDYLYFVVNFSKINKVLNNLENLFEIKLFNIHTHRSVHLSNNVRRGYLMSYFNFLSQKVKFKTFSEIT